MYSFMDPRVQQHLLPVPLVRRDVDDFRACAKIFTLDTRAQFWDMSAPGKQDDILDDAALRAKLAGLVRLVQLPPHTRQAFTYSGFLGFFLGSL